MNKQRLLGYCFFLVGAPCLVRVLFYSSFSMSHFGSFLVLTIAVVMSMSIVKYFHGKGFVTLLVDKKCWFLFVFNFCCLYGVLSFTLSEIFHPRVADISVENVFVAPEGATGYQSAFCKNSLVVKSDKLSPDFLTFCVSPRAYGVIEKIPSKLTDMGYRHVMIVFQKSIYGISYVGVSEG